MIKNIIFDLGNVLLKYAPKEYLSSIGFSGDELKELHKKVYGGSLWCELDRGTLTFSEARKILTDTFPAIKSSIDLIFDGNWRDTVITAMPESIEYLIELKQRGYNIYILSNFSSEWYEYLLPTIYFLKYTDGQVISSHVGMIKPERGIYELLLSRFALSGAESVFIDDLQANIEAAKECGIEGIVFTELSKVKQALEALLASD